MAETKFKVGEKEYTATEMAAMGAASPDLFYKLFFPKTARDVSPPFMLELDDALDDQEWRFVLAKVFRGGAKTTRLRLWVARRIAYGHTRTGVFVGPSEAHSARSLRWIRKQIQFNKVFSTVFGLRLLKWGDTEIGIENRVLGITSWLVGMGITTNVRGVNFDDYRPDLITLDDVITDENSASKDQREKINDLIHGAIRQSLAPAVDNPNSKMVMLQTPLSTEDAAALAEKDRTWKTITCSCWERGTEDSAEPRSSWPARFPTAELLEEKQSYLDRNEVSIFAREKECRLISKEKAAFKAEWLQVVDVLPAPGKTWALLAIDPVPPPSPREEEKGLKGKDYEAIVVLGHRDGNYFVHEYATNRGHDPSWTIAKTFELALKYKIFKIVVEGVAYQRTLKWILEDAMKRRQQWYMIEAVNDGMQKFKRIVGTIGGIAASRQLYCHTSHTEFIHQFTTYHTPGEAVDVLDAVSLGLSRLASPVLEMGADDYSSVMWGGKKFKAPRLRACP